jgi:cytochrome c553
MRKNVLVLGLVLAAAMSARAQQALTPAGPTTPGQAFQAGPRDWAFAVITATFPAEEGEQKVPGSTKSYTGQQIDNLVNPPDWFPDSHPPAPALVMRGRGGALACGSCHLMNGLGHPESADVTGYTSDYLFQQMVDFRSGARKDAARMNGIAKDLTDQEIREIADYFAKMKPLKTTIVKEVSQAPKTFVGNGRMRFLDPRAKGQTEPIGQRILTVPEDEERVKHRDPNANVFIAYAPTGSVAKGKKYVTSGGGGKSVNCTICHGDDLMGLGNVPRLAGVHPAYLGRQLFLFKDGLRNGPDAALMKKAVAQMTDQDVVNVAAYLASLDPTKPAPIK